MLLAHVSDPHFGTEEAPICAALREDLQLQVPDLIVLTGDITQRARHRQFLAARAFFDSLADFPLLAVPGNHDLPLYDLFSRFILPYRLYRRHFGPSLAPSWDGPEVAVVGVNSTSIWRHINGTLSRQRIEEVAARLETAAQPFKVVAVHHPLAAIQAADATNVARGSVLAVRRWIAAGADLFLGGHIHLPYCLTVGSPAQRAVLVQAGTAVSWRRRAGLANSYNLLRFDATRRQLAIERRDYDGAVGRFVRQSLIKASRNASGWQFDEVPASQA